MFIVNIFFGFVCLSGVINEFLLPENEQRQLRLFLNAIFMGLNFYFAGVRL
jgi:hypothetical protein